jgi:drug/metabolite transporter (DMT)-like permease
MFYSIIASYVIIHLNALIKGSTLHKKTKGYLMIATAGCLWGLVGFFVKKLLDAQLPLSTIIFWRMFFAFIVLFLYLYFTDRSKLKIEREILKYVIAIGLISQCLFNISYFTAIRITSIATAVTLLYTAPIFIAIMARIFFQELFTANKIAALLLCVAGCFLTVTGGSWENIELNSTGILMGLAAGLTFASLTILSKPISNKCHHYTIVFYSIGFGLLFYLPFSQPLILFQEGTGLIIWFYAFSLSIIATIFAYLFYIGGLSMGIEASKAGIISTVEVVVAVIVSYIFFNEQLVGLKLLGILMVIGSVITVQLNRLTVFKKS